MSDKISEKPDLWAYRDARQYVTDRCAWEQLRDQRFSLRRLGRDADFGSPSYIRMYLRGARNLKAESARRLGQALALSDAETNFFVQLVRFSQAPDVAKRAQAYKDLLQLAARYGGGGRIDAARLEYFSRWYIPVVHAMASLRGFCAEPDWIAARIVPEIKTSDARRALDTLFALRIFVYDDDGRFVVRERGLAMEPGLRHLWIREYHRSMIGLSQQAIDLWQPEDRVTSALTVTVPRDQLQAALARVDDFRREIFAWLMTIQENMSAVDGEVVQMNFQAFPLTRSDAQRPSE